MSSSRTAFLLGGLHALSFDNSVIAEHEFQGVGSLGATNAGRVRLISGLKSLRSRIVVGKAKTG
jgi:hypothetical protein